MQVIGATLAFSLAVATALPLGAQEVPETTSSSLFGRTSASVTYGPYVRFEAGTSSVDFADGNWLPPGPADPRVFFDIGNETAGFASAAVGFDWMNGFRADVGLLSANGVDAVGPWSYTVPADPGPHANITDARVRTTALMGSVFYSPLEQRGVNSRVQPYVVAGLGFARNKMSDWTRENAASPTPVRVFEGDSNTELAYSLGLGVSVQLTPAGKHPVLMDLSWRYYDFGEATGGTGIVLGGGGIPREGFSVDRRDSVVSIGIRIPLMRY